MFLHGQFVCPLRKYTLRLNSAMYGLVIEGFKSYVSDQYSHSIWEEILKQSGYESYTFDSKQVYDEAILPNLFTTASRMLQIPEEEIKYATGKSFVRFMCNKGYGGILRVLGRQLKDFLNGLDNLHEFLRCSYPEMKPPSFFCVNESPSGITLEYRSHRANYVSFFMGYMEAVSLTFFKTEMKITVIVPADEKLQTATILRLHFDNTSYVRPAEKKPLPARVFFEAFPFNFVFDRGMKLVNVGRSMANALPNILGKKVSDVFIVKRPLIQLNWNAIMLHTNNIFELTSTNYAVVDTETEESGKEMACLPQKGCLRLRGQMKFMSEWDAIVFIGTPIMQDVDAMWEVGLFLNDLSMHDSSRDMVLTGEQQAAELKLALEQKFEEVTLLLSDVVGFTNICSGLSPLEVVNLLNRLYSCFDALTEKHKVYKVETIGDAYIIASGCPIRTKYHAPFIAEMALDMVNSVQTVKDESKNPPESLRIRIGMHTGPTVAGVVGVKMPRYCLFGSTVTTVEVMEATSADGGVIRTYWLNGRRPETMCEITAKLCEEMDQERSRLADSNLSSHQQQSGEGWESMSASRCSSARTHTSRRSSMARGSLVCSSIAEEIAN
ncbi:guanylate cyclase soluble subunit beta [Clonorchis sinensis]|uniref:guanylate cyclase n=1 Tax=Clonorchis sinensis TaxID=79923 RepID=G7Y7K2_CLOSI|nr:guanylate cyclase soluble subunit beta [Clonorchis sinensis]